MRLAVSVLRELLSEKAYARLAFESRQIELLLQLLRFCDDPGFLADLCVVFTELGAHDFSGAKDAVRRLAAAFRESLFADYFPAIFARSMRALDRDPGAASSRALFAELHYLFQDMLRHFPGQFSLAKVPAKPSTAASSSFPAPASAASTAPRGSTPSSSCPTCCARLRSGPRAPSRTSPGCWPTAAPRRTSCAPCRGARNGGLTRPELARLGLKILGSLLCWGPAKYARFFPPGADPAQLLRRALRLRLRARDFGVFSAATTVLFNFSLDCYDEDAPFLDSELLAALLETFFRRFPSQAG